MGIWSTSSKTKLWREAPGTEEINIVISCSGRGNYCWFQYRTDSQIGCIISIQRPGNSLSSSHVLFSRRGNRGEKARKRTQSYRQTANLFSSLGGMGPAAVLVAELTWWYSLPTQPFPRSPPAWEGLESLNSTQTSHCLRLLVVICISAPALGNQKLQHYYKMGKH